LQAIEYATAAGMLKLELETYCLNLKTALTTNIYDASTGGSLFQEIKFLLHDFIDVRVIYSPGTCNRVAHKLATLGADMADGYASFWPDVAQDDVITLVADDLMSASI
jgi:hypothetical protein